MDEVTETSYEKYAKDVFVIGSTNALVALSGIILLPLLTKTLGAHDYGIWSQVQVTIQLVVGIVGLGLPFAIIRFFPVKTSKGEIREEFYSALCVTFFVTLIISLAMILAADFIARVLFEDATDIVRITGLIILVMSLTVLCQSLFRAFRQMKKVSVFMLADTYGQVFVVAILVMTGYNLLSVILGVLAVRIAIFAVLLFLIQRQIGVGRPRFSRIREYLSFGLPFVPGGISSWVVTASDRYVIAYFLGATSVGIYSAGYGLGNVLLMIAVVLNLVLPPTLSKLYDEGRLDEVRTHLSYSLKYLLAIAIPFVFGAALLGEQVLRMFSTPEIAYEGRYIVPLVAVGCLFWCVGVMPSSILALVKRTRVVAIAWGAAAVLNLALNLLVVPYIGILGAAITTLVSYLLALVIRWYYASKEFTFDIGWRFIGKSLTGSVIMSLVVWLIAPEGTLSTLLAIGAGVATYGVSIFLLKGFRKEEFEFFKGLFQRG
ncbi:MAG: flippase [Chloroflexota bacterium]|nr:flippase [Chloroflexota bacterium]